MLNIRNDKIKETDRVGFFTHKGSEIRILQTTPRPHVKPLNGPFTFLGIENLIPSSSPELVSHMVMETAASVLLTYSVIYMPISEQDYLKQYVGSFCIFAIVVSLKDSHYFFPDGTPFVTAILWAATLYTDERGQTQWKDMFARVLGQLIGWGLVFGMATRNKDNIIQYSDTPHHYSPIWLHAINEGLATMIECIAIAFAIIPILSPYDNQEPSRAFPNNRIKAKSEAEPPSNSTLLTTALSLAVIHYSLERTFQATMNPFNTIIQVYMQENNPEAIEWWAPIVAQFVGLIAACAYVSLYRPSDTTLAKLKQRN